MFSSFVAFLLPLMLTFGDFRPFAQLRGRYRNDLPVGRYDMGHALTRSSKFEFDLEFFLRKS